MITWPTVAGPKPGSLTSPSSPSPRFAALDEVAAVGEATMSTFRYSLIFLRPSPDRSGAHHASHVLDARVVAGDVGDPVATVRVGDLRRASRCFALASLT
jgi:hypothetical protein